jgi:hypothetical protein
MIHPDTALRFIDQEIGYGVVATRKIPRGTITWALDKFDLLLPPNQVEASEPIYTDIIDKFCFRNKHGDYVLCWDLGKYVNHSFNSNCLSTGYDFEIAIRDIEAGEELTNDYGYLNLSEPFEPRKEDTARTMVYPDDLPKYFEVWDGIVRQSFPFILDVEQPLADLIPAAVIHEVRETVAGRQLMKSILSHYYEDAPISV